MMNEIILLIIIGIVAGVLAGLFGVGGGIIVIPALIYIFGMNQHQAQGTSIAFLLLPVGILAFMNYYRAGYINIKFAAILAAAFVIGGYFGSKVALNIPDTNLKKVFAVFIILVGVKMLFSK
ncbi:MAG: sulfite exporter TauE/SafE family protein [Bacteroidales bacterium]|nr:sulfite exporter TauE/SafE family protein [Bacteroidales bacterium]